MKHRTTLVAGTAIAAASLLCGATGAGAATAGPRSAGTAGDNVVSWPSVEPADDYTASSTLAFALAAAGR